MRGLKQIYEDNVLRRPVVTLIAVTAVTLSLGWFAQDFSLDASADSLVLEQDEDLEYYRYVRARYGSDDFLIVTYTPAAELFGEETLGDIATIRDKLAALPNIDSVTTILDVPLVSSPAVDLGDMANGIRYLRDPATDRDLAKKELSTSPLFRNLLISNDAGTTAIHVALRSDPEQLALREQRDLLREGQIVRGLTPAEEIVLDDVSARYDIRARASLAQRAEDIASIRAILDIHRNATRIHLGGVPMIVADSMDYIRHDLLIFGLAILVFLVLILRTAFRLRRWVMLPLITCAATCLAMIGLLGLLNWRVTVVSSNFVSLLLILSLALTLHIIVRYREIHERNPDADQFALVSKTVRRIVQPCFFTALTTIVAFGSLLVSGIRPVIDFGWMMSLGIVVAFIMSFTLFPAALMLLEPGDARSRKDLTARITGWFARIIHRYGVQTLSLFSLFAVLGLIGVSQLTVENRFIDYYKESTEIYRGMELIDMELGGTTPLDVIIDAPPAPILAEREDTSGPDDEFEDIYADETVAEAGITSRSYWLNNRQLDQVTAIHDYFDALPDTGKVISLATFAEIIEQLDPEVLEDNFELSVLYEKLPADVRDTMISPYLSEDGNQLRFGVRIFESDPTLRRSEFLQSIRTGLRNDFGLDESRVHLSGMLVLYNNMLQSLFRSQILTLGAVFLAIMAMFLILFRSLKTAVIGVIPNLLSAALVLGLMGWFGIPLDLMTITIAAITVGIGVDDTIHYIHRFRHEFAIDGDYWASVYRCHHSIGRAIYYTSLTIMLGFSILALSRFIPTIYFGLLTGLAMLIALLANMTLLPLLVVRFKAAGEPVSNPQAPHPDTRYYLANFAGPNDMIVTIDWYEGRGRDDELRANREHRPGCDCQRAVCARNFLDRGHERGDGRLPALSKTYRRCSFSGHYGRWFGKNVSRLSCFAQSGAGSRQRRHALSPERFER